MDRRLDARLSDSSGVDNSLAESARWVGPKTRSAPVHSILFSLVRSGQYDLHGEPIRRLFPPINEFLNRTQRLNGGRGRATCFGERGARKRHRLYGSVSIM